MCSATQPSGLPTISSDRSMECHRPYQRQQALLDRDASDVGGHGAPPDELRACLSRRASAASDSLLPRAGLRPVVVVEPPPLVWRGLRVALRRVLPLLLATERGDVEVVPGAPHRLVAAAGDEVGAVDPLAVADEGVGAVPRFDAEVDVEGVGDRVPGDELP